MNLRSLVVEKINELGGPEQAAEFFGKKSTTIKTWLKPHITIPMDAVQKVLDSQDQQDQSDPTPPPRAETAGEDIPQLVPEIANPLALLQGRLADLECKLSNIEYFLQHGQMPPVQTAPGYGFRPSPVPNTVIPPGIPLQASQVNTAVPPAAQPTPVIGGNTTVTQGKGPYLPAGNMWCQPHPTPPATR